MGRNQRDASIRDQQKDQRNNKRDDDRQAGNFRQDKRVVILIDRTGPGDPRAGLSLAMVTRLPVTATVEMETAGDWCFEFSKTCRTHDGSDQPDADEQTGDKHHRLRSPARRSSHVHGTRHVGH